jgi:hypothetical protein
MRLADEPVERVMGRQLSRSDTSDPRGPVTVEKGPFDRFLADLHPPSSGTRRPDDRRFKPRNRPLSPKRLGGG